MGGGTLDLSVLTIDDGTMAVVGSGGDAHLGGEDMTRALEALVMKRLPRASLPLDTPTKAALRDMCERAKVQLSTEQEVSLQGSGKLAALGTVTRAQFVEACADVLARCGACVRKVLEECDVSAADIQEVVVVGGASKTPCVRDHLSQAFGGKVCSCTCVCARVCVCVCGGGGGGGGGDGGGMACCGPCICSSCGCGVALVCAAVLQVMSGTVW